MLVGLTASAAALAVPSYVGKWNVFSGPPWDTAPPPPTYTGQQAAALLFGGLPSDYAISTVDETVANINHKAWVHILGKGFTDVTLNQVAENHAVDTGNPGYDELGDTSAYVQDNGNTQDVGFLTPPFINYAFRINDNGNQVPEPMSLALVGLGLFGIGAVRRRSKV